MSENNNDNKTTKHNLNTILLGISLAVLTGIGGISFNNAVKLGELAGGQITRAEFELKIAQVQVDLRRNEVAIGQLQVDLAKLSHNP